MKTAFLHIWARWHATFMLLFGVHSLFSTSLRYVLIGSGFSFLLLILGAALLHPGLRTFANPANWLTMIRLYILIASVALFGKLQVLVFTGLIIAVLILDGLDGYLARRLRVESSFGALFDLETDALLAALLSLLVYSSTDIGPWVLVPGFMRYIFVTARYLSYLEKVRLNDPIRGSKTIAVFFFISLLSALILPVSLARILLIISGLCILYSFGMEYIMLIRRKQEPDAVQTGARQG